MKSVNGAKSTGSLGFSSFHPSNRTHRLRPLPLQAWAIDARDDAGWLAARRLGEAEHPIIELRREP